MNPDENVECAITGNEMWQVSILQRAAFKLRNRDLEKNITYTPFVAVCLPLNVTNLNFFTPLQQLWYARVIYLCVYIYISFF